MLYLLIILAVSLLVIIHEFGHYLVARAFGMRVVTYSIGFGPVLVRWRPKGSETVFQIAAIPLLAYVQIAGMNPRETLDPSDRGSYQNASRVGRFFTIAAGPLANYLAAALIMFGLFAYGGRPIHRLLVGQVFPGSPAEIAGFRSGDEFVRVNRQPVSESEDFKRRTDESRGGPMEVVVRRGGREMTLAVTARWYAAERRHMIGVRLEQREVHDRYVPMPLREAARNALVLPARASVENVRMLGRMISGRDKLQVMGPVGIVHETAREARHGWRDAVWALSMLSLALFIFNLLPVPALDGGRLVFLLYEMVMRRKPSPTFEARATAISMVLLLGLSAVVIVRDIAHIATRT